MKKPMRNSGQMSIAGIGDLILMTLLLLTGMALMVPLQEGWRLEKRLQVAQARLDELQELYPLYVEISTLDKPAKWQQLVTPVPEKLSEGEVPDIPARFAEIATRYQLELIAATPRLNNDDVVNCLDVEISASGPYSQLNAFLANLAQLPMMDSIRKLEIRRESPNEQFKILVRLALER